MSGINEFYNTIIYGSYDSYHHRISQFYTIKAIKFMTSLSY